MLPWLKEISEIYEIDYRIFVEPHEKHHYKLIAPREKLVVLNESHRRIGYAAKAYSEYAEANGYKYIFRMDDDLYGWTSTEYGGGKKSTYKNFGKMWKDVMPLFDKYPKLGAVRYIGGRNHFYEHFKAGKKRKWIYLNQDLWGERIVRIELEKLITEEMITCDDACLSAIICESGYHILTYAGVGMTKQINTNVGGFQSMDRADMTKEVFEYIKTDYPKIKLRKNKFWFGVDLNVDEYCPKISLPVDVDLSELLSK